MQTSNSRIVSPSVNQCVLKEAQEPNPTWIPIKLLIFCSKLEELQNGKGQHKETIGWWSTPECTQVTNNHFLTTTNDLSIDKFINWMIAGTSDE